MLTAPYIAGFFDGEGHVGIGRKGDKDSQVTIGLTNTHEHTLRTIAEFLTAHQIENSIYNHRLSKLGRKRCYTLALTNHKTKLAFLKLIAPYAITKSDAIRKAITFIESKQWLSPFDDIEISAALDAYRQGASLREIERQLGVSSRTVRTHARRLNVTLRSRGAGISNSAGSN